MQDKTDTDIPALYRGSVHAKIFHIASYGNQTIDIAGAHQNSNGSRDLTMPFSGAVCHPWTSTCYCQPTYQI